MRLETRIVIVLDEDLPAAEAINAAAVLGLSTGAGPADLGDEGVDKAGLRYGSLDQHPVPVLEASQDQLRELHQRFTTAADVHLVAFT